jgi:hypothetical protein
MGNCGMFRVKWVVAVVLLCGGVASTASALPVAINQYRLNGNFSNTGSGGTGVLTGVGGGSFGTSFGSEGYFFTPQGGLSLTGLTLVDATYTIAVDFYLDDPVDGSYNKIIDTSGLTDDAGVYANPTGALAVYTLDQIADPLPGQFFPFKRTTLVLTRNDSAATNEVSVWMDGVLQASGVNDISGFMETGGSLAWFLDDPLSCGGGLDYCPEYATGFVDDIRLWNTVLSASDIMSLSFGLENDLDPIPEPTSLLLLGTGLVLVARRMRKGQARRADPQLSPS